MAGDVERSQSLKEVLCDSLNAILSPEQHVRDAGEQQIKALEVTDEFGVHLTELSVDPQAPLGIRQLASVLLKQYVEAHWSVHSDKFRPPETNENAKAVIRELLQQGLKESISKVRASVAYAVSAIATWDWPEAWPQLFQILMENLTSGNPHAVHGAMRVLTEFCREVTDIQMPQVAPVILPEMYKIFTQAEVYSIRTRGRAVDIFNTIVGMVSAMAEMNKGIVKQLVMPVLPQFTEAFVQALPVPDGLTSDCGLKMEVLKALTLLMRSFPSTMTQWLPQILPPVWNILTQSAEIYVKTSVNDTEESDDPVDSDGEVLGFENLVSNVFEFVHAMLESSKFRSTVKKAANDMLYYIIVYMQITEEQIRMWTNNPDQFVEDEDDDSLSYSVRISAQDLLLAVCGEFPKECAEALCVAATRHIQEAEAAKATGNPHWWKVHESVMLCLGSVRNLVIEKINAGQVQFDLNGFLQNVVLQDLNLSVSPFLIGRCLWTASRYTTVMQPELIQRFIQATVGGLHATQPPSIRISATRAVFGFCDHLKASDNIQLILPYLPDIMEGLVAIATQFSSEVLALCMETMSIVLSVDKGFTAQCESKVTPLTIAIFLKHCGDPLVISLTQDIFKELSENEACRGPLLQRILPTITSILTAQADKVPLGIQSVALDILQTLVRGSPPPVPEGLIQQAFPAAVRCILSTDDNAAMQSGGECVRAYVSVALEQIAAWRDEQGHSGLSYVVQVISRLLDPKTPEYAATFVGRLVSIFISKLGQQLGEDLDLMLRMVLSKMQQTETLSVAQNLVLVFAHLMHSQMDAVLNFLYNVPGPTGKPALEFVLVEWCSRQTVFYGAYERKVSAVALSKLLQHAIESNDPRLQNIEVKGDPIVNPNEGIRTRSKAAKNPEQWTTVPVLVKIYKLLISELNNQIENNTHAAEGDSDEENGWEDEEDENVQGQTLSSILSQYADAADYPGYDLVEDEEDDDPDIVNDPVNQINLQAYLTQYLQSLSQLPCYSMFSQHTNQVEQQVLKSVGIQT